MSVCERCRGVGFEIVEKDGREYAQPCACRQLSRGVDGVLAACRIPPRYEHCTFANFQPGSATLADALEKCLRYCREYPYVGPTDEGLGLLFTGSTGVGKTHLAVAVLQELVTQKGGHGQFWDFHALIREIKNSYNPEIATTELQVLEPVVEADVLLLDDLGAWKMTDWMVDTLFYILNSRYMAKRATLITTNFQDVSPDVAARSDEVERKGGVPRRREYLVERIGAPLRSRLMEMSLVINILGNDRREVLQAGNNTQLFGRSDGSRGRP